MSTPTTRVMHGFRATPTAVSGEGVWLVTEHHRVLDGSGGAAVSCLGHQSRVLAAEAAG
jgi:adenosylmethionine-8-amino-7-oxononanoate aminotransferase